jgi:DNA-binding LacI/PurR family transcriptional regulator
VQAASKELGYRPNLAARNLAVGGSGVMLYVVPRIALGELLLEVGIRLTTALARHGVVLSLQFETDDGRNVVDAVANLNPIAVTRVLPSSTINGLMNSSKRNLYGGSGTRTRSTNWPADLRCSGY